MDGSMKYFSYNFIRSFNACFYLAFYISYMFYIISFFIYLLSWTEVYFTGIIALTSIHDVFFQEWWHIYWDMSLENSKLWTHWRLMVFMISVTTQNGNKTFLQDLLACASELLGNLEELSPLYYKHSDVFSK